MQENVELKEYTTLKLGGKARYFFKCKNKDDLVSIVVIAKSKSLPIFPLGGGSNIIVSDILQDMVCVKMENIGIEVIEETGDKALVCVNAGEDWDKFVAFTVEHNFCGVEALSGIPGTCGASPIQNIGAYGAEVSNNIESVRGYNVEKETFEVVSNKDCQFGYRNSVFKNKLKGKFIIESVLFKLSKNLPKTPSYPMVESEVAKISSEFPTLPLVQKIRTAIKKIRAEKLPDPKEEPNVGSFFKNVFVDESVFYNIKVLFPDVPVFKEEKRYKIPAGWLVEKVGFKGYKSYGVGVHQNHALVLVNFSSGSTENLLVLARKIQLAVKERFGLMLEIEPEIIT